MHESKCKYIFAVKEKYAKGCFKFLDLMTFVTIELQSEFSWDLTNMWMYFHILRQILEM